MTHMYKSNQEFTDQLRSYIKDYLEREEAREEGKVKEELEAEIIKVREGYEEKICQLTIDIDEQKAGNCQLKTEADILTERMSQYQDELE